MMKFDNVKIRVELNKTIKDQHNLIVDLKSEESIAKSELSDCRETIAKLQDQIYDRNAIIKTLQVRPPCLSYVKFLMTIICLLSGMQSELESGRNYLNSAEDRLKRIEAENGNLAQRVMEENRKAVDAMNEMNRILEAHASGGGGGIIGGGFSLMKKFGGATGLFPMSKPAHNDSGGSCSVMAIVACLVANPSLALGFVANPSDTCVMYLSAGADFALLAIYVDDLLLLRRDHRQAQSQVQLCRCLGMCISTSADRHTITLDLEQYLTTIVTRYEFSELQSVPTPMLHDLKLTKEDCPTTDEAKEAMRAYPFRSAISSLMFAMVVMRADLSYVVTCIARFSANPGLPHWNALVRVYQYVKGTADMKLTYTRIENTPAPLLYGYSDAEWATTDIDERRTCIGYCLFLSGAVILWLTRFWKPCLSSMEGEFGGVTEIAKNTIAARELMASLPLSWHLINKGIPTTVLLDATATK
jgi:hypothetical protein